MSGTQPRQPGRSATRCGRWCMKGSISRACSPG